MAQDAYIGAIFMFAGNFAPSNYQLCQGQIQCRQGIPEGDALGGKEPG